MKARQVNQILPKFIGMLLVNQILLCSLAHAARTMGFIVQNKDVDISYMPYYGMKDYDPEITSSNINSADLYDDFESFCHELENNYPALEYSYYNDNGLHSSRQKENKTKANANAVKKAVYVKNPVIGIFFNHELSGAPFLKHSSSDLYKFLYPPYSLRLPAQNHWSLLEIDLEREEQSRPIKTISVVTYADYYSPSGLNQSYLFSPKKPLYVFSSQTTSTNLEGTNLIVNLQTQFINGENRIHWDCDLLENSFGSPFKKKKR